MLIMKHWIMILQNKKKNEVCPEIEDNLMLL